MEATTIAAIATPVARSAVGIVRVSGPACGDIVSSVFRFSRYGSGAVGAVGAVGVDRILHSSAVTVTPNRLNHGYIVDGNSLIDEVLLFFMPGPHSYTGEDVLEIHAHGGPLVLQTILSLVLRNGADPATPGEFTRRAFLNGKIDLTQAEAVADIIDARSQQALSAAVDQVAGGLKRETGKVRAALFSLLADINAEIEFGDTLSGLSDSDSDDLAPRVVEQVRHQALNPVRELIERHDSAWYIKTGVRVALSGRPNAGKSTLLNRLLGRDRAIVSPIPGTTRDVLEETVVINDTPFVFFDMAGIGEVPGDGVERFGMDRARAVIAEADAVVYLVDVSDTGQADIPDILGHPRVVVAANKIDLADRPVVVHSAEPDRSLPVVKISALTGQGLPDLKQVLVEMFPGRVGDAADGAIPNPRHRQLLIRTQQSLESLCKAAESGFPLDMLAIDLQAAISALDEINGACLGEAVLDAIFEKFCVGK